MTLTPYLILFGLGLVNIATWTFGPRVRRWWSARSRPFVDYCEECGATPRRIWSLIATFDDDERLGILDGGSFCEATYCRAHRPAGARRRPNRRR